MMASYGYKRNQELVIIISEEEYDIVKTKIGLVMYFMEGDFSADVLNYIVVAEKAKEAIIWLEKYFKID